MVTSALVVVRNPTLAASSEVGIKMADGGVEQDLSARRGS